MLSKSKAILAKKNSCIISFKRLYSCLKELKCYSNCALVDKAKKCYTHLSIVGFPVLNKLKCLKRSRHSFRMQILQCDDEGGDNNGLAKNCLRSINLRRNYDCYRLFTSRAAAESNSTLGSSSSPP